MNKNQQNGFSAIMAVIVIVMIALLAAFMLTFSTISAINTGTSTAAVQAWFAARSGVQWAVHQALALDTCTGVNGETISSGLNGFTASILCSETTGITEGSATYEIYDIDVTATKGSVETFVSRTISVTVTNNAAP